LPVSDVLLKDPGRFADAEATGSAIDKLSDETNNKISNLSSTINKKIDDTSSELNNKIDTNINKLTSDMTTMESEIQSDILDLSNTKLNKAGDEMSGILSMNGHAVTNIPVPVNDTDAVNKLYVDNKHFVKTATIGLNWIGDEEPFTQNVAVSDILSTDYPHISPIYSDTLKEAIEQKYAWGLVNKAETINGEIIFTCFEYKPEVEIPIQIEVNR
jgi:gas vesicle protein